MNEWLNWHTLIVFLLGVLLSSWAKGLFGSARSKLGA